VGLQVERFEYLAKIRKEDQELEWARFRIQWADFRNVNRGKKGRVVRPQDLIKLSFDVKERPAEYHEIDFEAAKRRLGSKLKKNGK
jgi:hypothetical protein